MHLTPHEQERLMIRVAADLVERRLRRDPALHLNYPEVMALFAAYVLEEARHGKKTVAQLMDTKLSDVAQSLKIPVTTPGSTAGSTPVVYLTTINVMPGVREMIGDVQVEATFKDGTKLVTIPYPLGPPQDTATVYPGKHELLPDHTEHAVQYNADEHDASLSAGPLWAENTATRPIQVGSHYHLADVNEGLRFSLDQDGDEPAVVRGKRLHIAAGTSERFEPGDKREVWVVPLRGEPLALVKGLRAGKTLTDGSELDPVVSR
ncbi:urease subunit gamma/beta [Streptomyces sp. OV198]|jgi:urease subunit gamma/beta|uniref:urease subunit gamma n=1 Tax=Streptomyces sp. OV198 TaxID=1882787 RepID=UPI000BD29A46|nr:urease subunit gamma [Streptomyces sp. OV198]SOF02098.1 urease subunit gamma/beta [Streptomyces sp. OV198]